MNRSELIQWIIAVLIGGAITGVVVWLVRWDEPPSELWIRTSIASAAMFFMLFAYYMLCFRRRRTGRFFLVASSVVNPHDRIDVVKMGNAEFWSSYAEEDAGDNICSVCLSGPEAEVPCGHSKCCQSFFHRDCMVTYWESVNNVICPNCRRSVTS